MGSVGEPDKTIPSTLSADAFPNYGPTFQSVIPYCKAGGPPSAGAREAPLEAISNEQEPAKVLCSTVAGSCSGELASMVEPVNGRAPTLETPRLLHMSDSDTRCHAPTHIHITQIYRCLKESSYFNGIS